MGINSGFKGLILSVWSYTEYTTLNKEKKERMKVHF